MKLLRWVLGIFFAIIVIHALTGPRSTDSAPAATPAPVSAQPPKAPSDPVREAAFQKAVKMMRVIKADANDPDSIEVADAFYTPDGTVVVKYRGRNAFNAKIINIAIWSGDGTQAANGTMREVAPIWNKYVAHKPSMELTDSLQGAALLHAY